MRIGHVVAFGGLVFVLLGCGAGAASPSAITASASVATPSSAASRPSLAISIAPVVTPAQLC
jgi:hypothetical protein